MDQQALQKELEYSPDNGIFVWKTSRRGRVKIGDEAGSPHKGGYVQIRFFGKDYLAHRIALIISGIDLKSTDQVDHINGDRADNRLANLRIATRSQNCQNAFIRKDNISGFKGVGFDVKRKKWRARITANKKCKWIGYFDKIEEAHAAYCQAAKELHGTFHKG